MGILALMHMASPAMEIPQLVRPLVASGALLIAVLGAWGLVGNQFGYDRGGFRVYVLAPALRRDVLLGKNLALVPLALIIGTVAATLVQIFWPQRLDLFLAQLPQLASMYMIVCMLANWQSILAPLPIPASSLGASRNVKMLPALLTLAFLFVLPFALLPTLLPFAIEILVNLPVCLPLSLLECTAIYLLYRLMLTWQGKLLQASELRILDTVASKTE